MDVSDHISGELILSNTKYVTTFLLGGNYLISDKGVSSTDFLTRLEKICLV